MMKLSVAELENKIIWLESLSTRARILSKEDSEKRFLEIKKKLSLFLKNTVIEIPPELEKVLNEADQKAKELDQASDQLSRQ